MASGDANQLTIPKLLLSFMLKFSVTGWGVTSIPAVIRKSTTILLL